MQRMKRKTFQTIMLCAVMMGFNAVQAEIIECTEIGAVPFTINTEGVYCFKKDLVANVSSGAAISVAANNVTIDLNGFTLGNLAGADTQADGVSVVDRANVIVRNGTINGYLRGISLSGGVGGSHLVENMLLEENTSTGIIVDGPWDVTLRNNTIIKTGGSTVSENGDGIWVEARGAKVVGNDVKTVFSAGASPARGIHVVGENAQILNNSVSDLDAPEAASENYVFYFGHGAVLDGNRIINPKADGQTAIVVSEGALAVCSNNLAVGFNTAVAQCEDGGGNVAAK